MVSIAETMKRHLTQMHEDMQKSNGILVLFGSDIRTRLHSSNLEDLTEGLTPYGSYDDGEIFQINPEDVGIP